MGIYAFHTAEAARIAMHTVWQWLEKLANRADMDSIIFVLFDGRDEAS
jgi:hypothetical protein